MQDWNDLDPHVRDLMTEQISYAFRYWVSLDPATRAKYLHPTISLDPDDFEVDGEALPAFMAWAKLTTMTEVNRLSGWDRDHA